MTYNCNQIMALPRGLYMGCPCPWVSQRKRSHLEVGGLEMGSFHTSPLSHMPFIPSRVIYLPLQTTHLKKGFDHIRVSSPTRLVVAYSGLVGGLIRVPRLLQEGSGIASFAYQEICEFPNIRRPRIYPKEQGSYHTNIHRKDPQFMETAIRFSQGSALP